MEMIDRLMDRLLSGDKDVIVAVVCAYAVVCVAWSLIHQLRVRRWPGVRGMLLREGLKEFGSGSAVPALQDYAHDVRYRYVVNGQKYVGSRVGVWAMVASRNLRCLLRAELKQVNAAPDGSVTVYYSPRRPAKAVLVKPGLPGMGITLLLGALPFLYYLP